MRTFLELVRRVNHELAAIIDRLDAQETEAFESAVEEWWENGYCAGFGAGYDTAVEDFTPKLAALQIDIETVLKDIHDEK
jgi:hypothetical protein